MEQPPSHVDFVIVDGVFFCVKKDVAMSCQKRSKSSSYCILSLFYTFDRILSARFSRKSGFLHLWPSTNENSRLCERFRKHQVQRSSFKFFIAQWADQDVATIIDNKTIYLSHDLCYVYSINDNKVTRTIDHELSCPDHEEAATKIVFLACHLKEDSTVTLRTSDTDIVVEYFTRRPPSVHYSPSREVGDEFSQEDSGNRGGANFHQVIITDNGGDASSCSIDGLDVFAKALKTSEEKGLVFNNLNSAEFEYEAVTIRLDE
ncbi:hypothetical protein JTB14_009321 [Gonioctena quinquepunctata]|nr:hypothetical protein JTB14_009321 [Gonioctena quinquepunctata]